MSMLMLAIGLAAALLLSGSFTKKIEAQSGSASITGYAWSSNAGWISFSCENSGTCASSNYSVSENQGSGLLSGYAWSNLGWITFNKDDLSGCPETPCQAKVNAGTGALSGWARACGAFADKSVCSGALETGSGGWDGWIHLAGSAYGVTRGDDCAWDGYAWGSDNFGWIHFKGVTYGVESSGSGCNAVSVSLEAIPPSLIDEGDVELTWESSGANVCNGVNFSTGGATAGSATVHILETTTFTITCDGNSASDSTDVVVAVTNPQLTLTAVPSTVQSGTTSTLSWSATNVEGNSCILSRQGGGWSTALGNDSPDSGSVTSPSITTETTFVLSCTGLGGSSATKTVTVSLTPTFEEF